MRLRPVVMACLVVALGCVPASSAPSTSPSVSPPIPTPGSTATRTAAASSTASPSTTAAAREIAVALDGDEFAAVADDEALITTRSAGTGVGHIQARDLRSRATTVVRANMSAPQVTAVREGVIAFVDYPRDAAEPMTQHVRVFAGRWRDPSTIVQLDDLVLGLVGGDAWNPLPAPQTNGWEVAWLHAPIGAPFELRVRDAAGQVTTVYTSTRPFTFALGRAGDVAIAELANTLDTSRIELKLYRAGTLQVLGQRPATESGYVAWSGGRLAWSLGLGLVRPMQAVELIDPATLARETVALPGGCFSYAGATEAQLSFLCGDHVELQRGSGPPRVGPPIPLVHPRAIIRTEPGPPKVAYVIPVVTADPRPGAGARF